MIDVGEAIALLVLAVALAAIGTIAVAVIKQGGQ